MIVVTGNGNANVDLKYSIDNGVDVLITSSNKKSMISVGFNISVELKAVNNDSVNAHNFSECSLTGVFR